MSSKSWRKNTSVIDQLINKPNAYSFFQAMRIVERASLIESRAKRLDGRPLGSRNIISRYSPPNAEIIRLEAQSSFGFPESEIHSIKKTLGEDNEQWLMKVNFMNLTGSMGVLPHHYTELLLQRLKQKDESFLDFLNLFNHRTISLFYQAATKYHLPIEYERKQLIESNASLKSRDTQTAALLSLLGLGTNGLSNRLTINDESLIFYGGLLNQRIKTASGLKQILQDYFAIPIKIQEFVGQWQELIPDIRTRLSSKHQPSGQNARLSQSAMLGHKGWFAQGKIRLVLGPLNGEQFYKFAPGTKALKSLNDIVRMYVGIECNFDFIIEVNRRDIPKKISLSKQARPIMGWNTWLSSNDTEDFDKSETLKITVSANRLK